MPVPRTAAIACVAVDGFSGSKTAAAEEFPEAVEVVDSFHVVKVAGGALGDVRRCIQQETTGHRGRAKLSLYRTRRTLHTDASLLTGQQQEKIGALFAGPNFTEVEATWSVYQDIVAVYRTEDRI